MGWYLLSLEAGCRRIDQLQPLIRSRQNEASCRASRLKPSAFQISHPVWSEIAGDVRFMQSHPTLSGIYQLHRETTSENAAVGRWAADCIYESHYSLKCDVGRRVYSWGSYGKCRLQDLEAGGECCRGGGEGAASPQTPIATAPKERAASQISTSVNVISIALHHRGAVRILLWLSAGWEAGLGARYRVIKVTSRLQLLRQPSAKWRGNVSICFVQVDKNNTIQMKL